MAHEGVVNDEIQCTNMFNVLPGGTMNVTLKQGDNVVNLFKKMGLQDINNEQNSDESPVNSDRESETPDDLKKTELDIDEDRYSDDSDKMQEKLKQGLKEIAEIQLTETSQLETLILILKQYVKMGEEAEYIETREKINTITSTTTDINKILTLAAKYMKNGQEFEMIVTCTQAVCWYKHRAMLGKDPQTCIRQMVSECMSLSSIAAQQMFKNKNEENDLYSIYIISMMYEMLLDVKDITEVNQACKVGMTTSASYHVACVHFFLDQWGEMYEICQAAISEIKDICGNNAKECLAFGDVLFMAGIAKYRLGQNREAEKLWREAVDTFDAEGSINSNPEKERNIRLVNHWLSLVSL
ncbi:uncharacterized protein LOC120347102 [Styela clava]